MPSVCLSLSVFLICTFTLLTATLLEYEHIWPVMHSGLLAMRKVSGAVPHDMGNPGEDPWNKVREIGVAACTLLSLAVCISLPSLDLARAVLLS